MALTRRALVTGAVAAGLVGGAPRSSRADNSATTVGNIVFLRGLGDVFSLGMNELAARLASQGLAATAHSYVEAEDLAEVFIECRRRGRGTAPIGIVGHSYGGAAALRLAAMLSDAGIAVAIVVALDPVGFDEATGATVQRVVNIYQSNNGFGVAVRRAANFRGTLENIDLAARIEVFGHSEMTTAPEVQRLVLARLAAAGVTPAAQPPRVPAQPIR